jgi:hypothetical protein
MKLDISCMQYMSKEEFRVLTAVEASADLCFWFLVHCKQRMLSCVRVHVLITCAVLRG